MMLRRAALAAAPAVLAAGVVVATAGGAGAHALYRSSSPANGADLERAPTSVVIAFTERPDPKISVIQVLDTTGRNVARGPVQPVAGRPSELRVPLGSVPSGVYTVTWRTVSEADGHTTAGSFTFGVDVPRSQIHPGTGFRAPRSPSPSPLGVAGRWMLYSGLAVLFAAAVMRLVVFRGALPAHRPILMAAWALAVVGLALMIVAERSSADVSFSQLISSTSGHHLIREAAALGGTTVALALTLLWPRTWSLALLGIGTAVSMLAHAINSHASAESPVWFNVAVQWMHLLSVGAWVGGLVWLVVGLRDRGDEERTTAAERFSWLAAVALAVVAVTGVVRAIDEVGTPPDWGRLVDTGFGVTLLVKLGLFVGLIAFAARNRYVNVPGMTRGTRPVGSIRRTVAAEIAIAAGIFGVTGVLSELAPSATVASAAQAADRPGVTPLVVTGHDFATSVRARLTVTPGTVGPNRFRAEIVDYDTGRPVRASSVQLQFSRPGDPEIGTPTVGLRRVRPGAWAGSGTVLSLNGRWNVDLLVQEPRGGVDVPLEVLPKLPPEHVQVSRAAGQPTVYTVSLPSGATLQGYLDPGRPGVNTVHFTFFSSSGNELPIARASATALTPSGGTRAVKLIRFGSGHFVVNASLKGGTWTFLIDATARQGQTYAVYFSPRVEGG